MSAIAFRPSRVPYRDEPQVDLDELAARAVEIGNTQHAANARHSILVGFGVAAACIAIWVALMCLGIGDWLGPILRHGFGGG